MYACTLRVDVHLGGAAAMPRSKQHTAAPTLVLHILERVHKVRDTSQAHQAAQTGSPSAITYQPQSILAPTTLVELTV